MACCSLRNTIAFGIFLAVLDILHGLATLGFYGYRFIYMYFFICPRELEIEVCHSTKYTYSQMYETRTYIGMGEGAITPIFDIILIVSLVKRLPCMTWTWLIKSFAVLGINVFFISSWLVRKDSYEDLSVEQNLMDLFIYGGAGLAIAQLAIMLMFCVTAAIYTYKVSQERSMSRRSLHPRSPRLKNGSMASAPPVEGYEDNMSYLHHGLNGSTNKLPIPSSNGSIDKAGLEPGRTQSAV